MLIPDDKIEEVRSASPIVEVVGDYVQLKKKGSNYFGLCPFHAEKTPSFSVNPGLDIYKCFGCGVAGDVYQFVMAIERTGFVEAVRFLADRAGIELPQEGPDEGRSSESDAIAHALRFAGRFYYHCLTSDPSGQPALRYLRERGFAAASIKHFGVGFAPDRWDALLSEATESKFTTDVLQKAGLIVPRKGGSGYYDRFRGRIMFPIFSHSGKVVGFGGRILDASEDQPKYVNSPETPVYRKSSVLYGLFQSKQAARAADEVYLVEGYTDVISLHQAGVENVVASSGTALTPDQVRLLARYVQRVVLIYDADAAGEAASMRGLELVLQEGLAAYAVALPPGTDPDSFVREKGGAEFTAYVKKHRQDFVSFRYDLARRSGALETPEGRTDTIGQLLELITGIEDPLAQETYLQRVAEVSAMPQTTLWRALEQRRQAHGTSGQRAPERAPRRARPQDASAAVQPAGVPREANVLPAEEALVRLMIEHGSRMVEFVLGHMSLQEFSIGLPRSAVSMLLQRYEEGALHPGKMPDVPDEELRRFIAGVMTDRDAPSENWRRRNINVPRLNEDALEAAAGAMTRLKLRHVQQEIERIREATFQVQEAGGDVTELQREGMALHGLRKQIERKEFIQWPEAPRSRAE